MFSVLQLPFTGFVMKNPAVLTSFVTLTRQLGQEILYTQNE